MDTLDEMEATLRETLSAAEQLASDVASQAGLLLATERQIRQALVRLPEPLQQEICPLATPTLFRFAGLPEPEPEPEERPPETTTPARKRRVSSPQRRRISSEPDAQTPETTPTRRRRVSSPRRRRISSPRRAAQAQAAAAERLASPSHEAPTARSQSPRRQILAAAAASPPRRRVSSPERAGSWHAEQEMWLANRERKVHERRLRQRQDEAGMLATLAAARLAGSPQRQSRPAAEEHAARLELWQQRKLSKRQQAAEAAAQAEVEAHPFSPTLPRAPGGGRRRRRAPTAQERAECAARLHSSDVGVGQKREEDRLARERAEEQRLLSEGKLRWRQPGRAVSPEVVTRLASPA